MNRENWLKKMQQECENQYDGIWSPLYRDGKAGAYENTTQVRYIHDLLSFIPQKSVVLDAACGSGRYLPFLLEKNHSVTAIDQSQGMLNSAKEKFSAVQFKKGNLQDISYSNTFDAAICVDAMENICPEDWPLTLNNFNKALKHRGYFYFNAESIELADENELKQVHAEAMKAGIPLIFGENIYEGVYHYHPTIQQIQEWTQNSGFEIIQEGKDESSYYHVLARKK